MSGSAFLLVLLMVSSFGLVAQAAGPLLKFERNSQRVKEGTLLAFHLDAIGLFFSDFFVEVELVPGTAVRLGDYSLLDDPLVDKTLANFTVGQINSTAVQVILIDNNAWEPLEYFTVRIVIPRGVEAMLGSPATMRVNIDDDDEVDVSFMESATTVKENERVLQLQLVSSGVYTNAFAVTVSCLEIFPAQAKVHTAPENDTDVYPRTHSVMFADLNSLNTVSSVLSMNIVDDLVTEPRESFICVILRPFGSSGIVVRDPDTLTVSILDDDILEISFEQAEYSGMEGDVVMVRLQASRSFVKPFKVRIFPTSLALDHPFKTAEAAVGDDYTNPSSIEVNGGIVEFDAELLGTLSTTLDLRLFADGLVERLEYFQLNFIFEEDETLDLDLVQGSPSTVLVSIQDKDTMFLRFQFPKYRATEGIGRIQIFLEAVQEDPDHPDTYLPAEHTADFEVVMATVAGTAQAPKDFVMKTTTVRFISGAQFSTPFNVEIVDDEVAECREEFSVEFIIPSEWRDRLKLVESNEAKVEVTDDDSSQISFTVNSLEVTEGENTSFALTVVSDSTFQDDHFIWVTARDVTAKNGEDYQVTTSTVTLMAGQQVFTPTLSIPIIDDVVPENVEVFVVDLIIPREIALCRGTHGENTSIEVTIHDDDEVFIRVKDGLYEVDEDEGSILFQLEVYNGTIFAPFDVTVSPTELTPVSATYKEDFTDEGGDSTASFTVGDTDSSVAAVIIVDDEISECDETFQVEFSLPSEMRGVVLLEPTTIDVTIKEDDVTTVRFSQDSTTVTEDPSRPVLVFYLETDREFERNQRFTIVAEDGTAMSGTDFTLLTSSVRVRAGRKRSGPIRVRIEDDVIVEDVEMFKLRFELNEELMDCRVELAEPSVVDITIEDDDPVFLRLNLRRIPKTIVEGKGAAIIQLEVENGTVFFPINVTVDVREISPTPIPEYALEFLDFYVFGDENQARFNRFDNVSTAAEIRTVDNQLCEEKEYFEVKITINQPRVSLIEPTHLNLTIIDDDTGNGANAGPYTETLNSSHHPVCMYGHCYHLCTLHMHTCIHVHT
jgi:hypothetical protein